MNGKKIYIFGAGASAAANLPIQKNIIKTIFSLKEISNMSLLDEDNYHLDLINQFPEFDKSRKYLANFIINNFCSSSIKENYKKALSVEKNDYIIYNEPSFSKVWYGIFELIKDIEIPLEDIFTMLDKASILKEYFDTYSSSQLSDIHKMLKDCIVYSLAHTMYNNQNENLYNDNLYNDTGNYFIKKRIQFPQETNPFSIITLNWDTLLDYHITKACSNFNEKIQLDYCCYNNDINSNLTSLHIQPSGIYNIKLLKLHGSMNWLLCPNCGRLYTDYKKNIALFSIGDTNFIFCEFCESLNRNYLLQNMIITPTFLKDINNIHFKNIWHNAYLDLCEAKK